MFTATTSPGAGQAFAIEIGWPPEPKAKPPPWIHTITGRLRASHAGVQTLRNRQSSFWIFNSEGVVNTWSICMPKSETGPAISPPAICIAGVR